MKCAIRDRRHLRSGLRMLFSCALARAGPRGGACGDSGSCSMVLVVSFCDTGLDRSTHLINRHPLIPDCVTTDGREVIESGAISAGQNVWQAMGGMEVGSIWGHGQLGRARLTADWLHREATLILDEWAEARHGRTYAALGGG